MTLPLLTADDVADAHDRAWLDHRELEWLRDGYVRAWNEQRHIDCIRIIVRQQEIKGTYPPRNFDTRCDDQKDEDEEREGTYR